MLLLISGCQACSTPPIQPTAAQVFAGGAALYFMRSQAAPVEVLNDINGEMVSLYRVVQNQLEEFVRQFKWALSSCEVFEWRRMTHPESLTNTQRAARFFYLQPHAFAGKVTGHTFGATTTGPAINLLRIEQNLSAALAMPSWYLCRKSALAGMRRSL